MRNRLWLGLGMLQLLSFMHSGARGQPAEPKPADSKPADDEIAAAQSRVTARLRSGYMAFLNAVKAENGAGIRATLWTPRADEPRDIVDLFVKQLLTLRRFERVAGQKLKGDDAGDFGFGLTDAAIDRRIKAAAVGEIADLRIAEPPTLYLPAELAGRDRVLPGLSADVPLELDGERGPAKLDLTRALPPPWQMYTVSLYTIDSESLSVFERATADIEAGRLTDRPAIERRLNADLKKLADRQSAPLSPGGPAPEADLAQARQAVRAYLHAVQTMDARLLRQALASADDKIEPAMIDRWVDEHIISMRLGNALAKMRGGSALAERPEFGRSLGRLLSSRLLQADEQPSMLLLETDDRLGAMADPAAHAGFKGAPPEYFVLVKTPDGWKVNADTELPESVRIDDKSRALVGADEGHARRKALLEKVEAGVISTESRLVAELEEIGRRVAAIAEQRRLEDEDREAAQYQKWAESDEGKQALKAITAPGGRLQFRLVLGADDPAEAELVPAPDRPEVKLRLAKEVLLNQAAIASAYLTTAQDGSVIVGIELTADGSRHMYHITSANIGRQIAIVFDGKVLIAPVIQSSIRQRLVLDGGAKGFTPAERDRLIQAMK